MLAIVPWRRCINDRIWPQDSVFCGYQGARLEGFELPTDGLAAERIINICRGYSGTGEYQAIVPNKAKSAATMVCLGASEILMGPSSELGPVDLQASDPQSGQWFSAYNIVQRYEDLFARAVQETGNLEPYVMQLGRYDEGGSAEGRIGGPYNPGFGGVGYSEGESRNGTARVVGLACGKPDPDQR